MRTHPDTHMILYAARRLARWIPAALVVASLLGAMTALAHSPGVTERVSVDGAGNQGNDSSGFLSPPALSADGRFVAFDSTATNLVPGGNLPFNVFVYDRRTGTTDLVSVSSAGRQGEGLSQHPAITPDGRFVAFDSDAANFVRGDTNGTTDVFWHDRATGTTIRVSVTSDGQQAASSSHAPAISADGRFVVFHANSSLAPEDTNGTTDVYVHDCQTGATDLASVASDGTAGNNASFIQDISADGRFVAFVSSASNLVANDANGFTADVYVRDRLTGTTELVSVANDGTQAEIGFLDQSPRISADGRFVAFSTLTSLVRKDTNGTFDIYLRDRLTGSTELISLTSNGKPGDGSSTTPAVSADGRFVAFTSDSSNFVPEQSLFPDEDVFVRDRQAGTTVRVSESSAGSEGNERSLGTAISGDGLVVAFGSEASNLVPDDTNGVKDIFVHDDRPSADLAVTKSAAPDPVRKGDTLTYKLVATNHGAGSAFAVELTDALPASVHFVSVTSTAGSCAEAAGTITCELGDLANGASATVTIFVTPIKVDTITNTARVSSVSPDPNQANNTAVVQSAVISR